MSDAWTRVNVVARGGMAVGILHNANGELTLVVRGDGEDWPVGCCPVPGTATTIAPGSRGFGVAADGESGYRVGDGPPTAKQTPG